MRVELNDAQVRYVMGKIESDVVRGHHIADQVERELDMVLLDGEHAGPRCPACGAGRHVGSGPGLFNRDNDCSRCGWTRA